MKRVLAVVMLSVTLALSAGPATAVPDDYDDTQSHPLRVLAYLVYPIGFAAEWLIFRPFHYFVSRPETEPVFGHKPHGETRVH